MLRFKSNNEISYADTMSTIIMPHGFIEFRDNKLGKSFRELSINFMGNTISSIRASKMCTHLGADFFGEYTLLVERATIPNTNEAGYNCILHYSTQYPNVSENNVFSFHGLFKGTGPDSSMLKLEQNCETIFEQFPELNDKITEKQTFGKRLIQNIDDQLNSILMRIRNKPQEVDVLMNTACKMLEEINVSMDDSLNILQRQNSEKVKL